MRVYLLAFGLEGILSFCLREKIDAELLMITYMMINSLLLISWFWFKSKDKTMFMILLGGFLLRLLALSYDRGRAPLPFNNTDAGVFNIHAVAIANALPKELLEYYTGFYSQVLGVIYYIFGAYRAWGHFINISLIMLGATKLIDIANLLKLKRKNIKLLIGLWVLMPIPLLMGYALLREASIYYFVILSIYYFIKWFEKYNIFYSILSVLTIYIASLYHGGVLVIALGYVYAFVFYDRKRKKIPINFKNIMFLIIAIFCCYSFVSQNSEELFSKVNMDTGGGSAYLTGIEIDTPIEFILFGPIKAFYLLFSPMPWLIRGFLDIITFLFDTLTWIIGSIYFYKSRKVISVKVKMLFISAIIGSMVFGMGTLNTGTAIRHRNKFLPFLIISIVYARDKNEKKKVLNKCKEDVV